MSSWTRKPIRISDARQRNQYVPRSDETAMMTMVDRMPIIDFVLNKCAIELNFITGIRDALRCLSFC